MKTLFISAVICLSTLSLGAAGEEVKAKPQFSILEALQVVLREIPEGKTVSSIEQVQVDEDTIVYYAVYDEKVVSYQTKELNVDGEYVEVTKYRRELVGAEVMSNDKFRLEVMPRDRVRRSASASDRRVIPRRRVVLD